MRCHPVWQYSLHSTPLHDLKLSQTLRNSCSSSQFEFVCISGEANKVNHREQVNKGVRYLLPGQKNNLQVSPRELEHESLVEGRDDKVKLAASSMDRVHSSQEQCRVWANAIRLIISMLMMMGRMEWILMIGGGGHKWPILINTSTEQV